VSSYVSFETFVLPALRRMMGLLPYRRPITSARLTKAFSSPPGRRQFVRATYHERSVTPVGGHGSHLIGDLATADTLIVVPEDATSVLAGEQVDVLRLDLDF
jgi:molybdopterin molybdotransferase